MVVGVDLDAESMRYTDAAYRGSQFIPGDVTSLGEMALPKMDVIHAFNSLYAGPDLEACF